jgi:hypothetical protein
MNDRTALDAERIDAVLIQESQRYLGNPLA